MRVAMVSCLKYRDAWEPFDLLFRRYWPGQEYDRVTDEANPGASWCQVVAEYAKRTQDVLCIFQEDFFLTASVQPDLVQRGLDILSRPNVGAVRLYPCPGATEDSGDPYFGRVTRYTAYRTSCQVTLWNPGYLREIASRFNTPAEFEIHGAAWASQHLSAEVWAFQRNVQPWPLEYLCSAISRGKWEPTALEYCKREGIAVDTSLRGVA